MIPETTQIGIKRLRETTRRRGLHIYHGSTPYSIGPIYTYRRCPCCNGRLGGYPRLAHPHGHRWYSRCHDCNYGAWHHEQDREIRALIASGEYEQREVAA